MGDPNSPGTGVSDPDIHGTDVSDPKSLRVDISESGVATLTIDRPAAHNALDRATMEAFAEAVEGLERSEADLRAVVVTGAGDAAFCSGGDQADLEHATAADDGAWLASTMGDALRRLERLPVPVVAAVEGHALGGGAEIALACDLRIVSERVRFGMVHRRLGLIPGWGGGQRLMRLVGYAQALEILLDARPLDAAALEALGLANTVVPPGHAAAVAHDLAERIAAIDPATVRAIKGLLQDGLTSTRDAALEAERARFPALWAGRAHLEAVRAFHAGTARAGRDTQAG